MHKKTLLTGPLVTDSPSVNLYDVVSKHTLHSKREWLTESHIRLRCWSTDMATRPLSKIWYS